MPNPFDQFDTVQPQQSTQTSGANPFDKFDSHANPFDRFDQPSQSELDFEKQMTSQLTPSTAHDATGTAVGGTNVLERAIGAIKGGIKQSIFGNPLYRKLAENNPDAINAVTAENPGMSIHDARIKVQQDVHDMFAKQLGQAEAEVDANSQGNHPILNSILPGLAGAPFDPVTYTPLPEIKAASPVAKALEPYAGKTIAKVGGKVAEAFGHGGQQGALMGGENAVDQGINIHDQVQDRFDPTQVVKSIEGGVLFGTGAHLAMSPFVEKLYANRGEDTTPRPDPTETTNAPVNRELSPEDQSQYHDLLNTGSAQDIHQFFNERNGPRPSPADVQQWVQYRDSVPEGYAQEEYQPQFDYAAEQQKQWAQDHIAEQTKDWKNAPDVNVVHSEQAVHSDNPELANAASDPSALGAYDTSIGKVHIFADRIEDADTLNSVLYHEALGHYGLAQKFGDSLDKTLQTLMDRNVGKFNDRVDDWQKENPGAYGNDRVRAAEEVLARDSQNGQIKPALMDAVSAQIRRYGRRMGLDLSYSDNEIKTILGMAHQAVVDGKGRDVVGNGFRYMFTGPKATNFDPNHETAFRANDGNIRNEISDNTAQVSEPKPDSINYLGDVLNHSQLYKEYPELRNMPVVSSTEMPEHMSAAYSPKMRAIYLNALEPKDRIKDILHEVQHAIQHIEQYPEIEKPSAKTAEEYLNHPIEKEAIATEDRIDLTDQQRLNNPTKFMKRSDLAASQDYVVKNLQETYDALKDGYDGEAVSHEETRRAALTAGFKPSQIRDLADLKDIGEKMYRIGAAAKMADGKLAEINARIGTPDERVTDQLAAVNAIADYKYFLARLQNNYAEIGRALNVKKAIGYTKGDVDNIAKLIEEHGDTLSPLADRDTYIRFMKQLNTLRQTGNNAGTQAMLTSVSSKPYWWQYLLSYRQNMMLSGLSTHLKSTMDMATNGFRDFEESVMALPGGLIRNVAQGLGMKVKSGVHPTEIAGGVWGMAKAALEAQTYKDTLEALRHGFQNQSQNGTMVPMPDMPGVLGLPSKMVAAQDTFFRSFLHNANLYNLGTRQAYGELKAAANGGKVKWDDVMSLGSSYALNPTPEMLSQAHEMANQTILMNKSPINSLIGQAKAIRPKMDVFQQGGSFLANLLTTFTRIQSNAFINQVIRRSPLFLLDKVSREDLAAGGARADIAWTRAIMGTALMGTYWAAADPKKDQMTGEGPASASKRAALEASGWRPNAVHENGQYQTGNNLNLSINPFDKHNNVAVMIAGLRQAYEEGAEKKDIATGLKLAAYSIVHDFTSSTFVNDLVPAMDAFTSRADTMGQKAQKFLSDEARTFLPNITNQAAKIIDSNQHDTGGSVVGAIEQNVPGLTNKLPIKYSVYGEPLKTGTTVSGLHNWVSPGNHQEELTDPTIKELSRLENSVTGTLVSPTQKTIRVMNVPLKLSTEQAEEYQMYTGKTIVQVVKEQMADPSWSKMSDQDKVNFVRGVEKDAKSQVKDALLQKEGWLNEDQLSSLRKQINGQ